MLIFTFVSVRCRRRTDGLGTTEQCRAIEWLNSHTQAMEQCVMCICREIGRRTRLVCSGSASRNRGTPGRQAGKMTVMKRPSSFSWPFKYIYLLEMFLQMGTIHWKWCISNGCWHRVEPIDDTIFFAFRKRNEHTTRGVRVMENNWRWWSFSIELISVFYFKWGLLVHAHQWIVFFNCSFQMMLLNSWNVRVAINVHVFSFDFSAPTGVLGNQQRW